MWRTPLNYINDDYNRIIDVLCSLLPTEMPKVESAAEPCLTSSGRTYAWMLESCKWTKTRIVLLDQQHMHRAAVSLPCVALSANAAIHICCCWEQWVSVWSSVLSLLKTADWIWGILINSPQSAVQETLCSSLTRGWVEHLLAGFPTSEFN